MCISHVCMMMCRSTSTVVVGASLVHVHKEHFCHVTAFQLVDLPGG